MGVDSFCSIAAIGKLTSQFMQSLLNCLFITLGSTCTTNAIPRESNTTAGPTLRHGKLPSLPVPTKNSIRQRDRTNQVIAKEIETEVEATLRTEMARNASKSRQETQSAQTMSDKPSGQILTLVTQLAACNDDAVRLERGWLGQGLRPMVQARDRAARRNRDLDGRDACCNRRSIPPARDENEPH